MGNLIEVCIPILCENRSKKHSKKIVRATKKFMKSSTKNIFLVDILKNIIEKHQNELYNPETFLLTIEEIFSELELYFGNYSPIYCNTLKRLISFVASEFGELVSDFYGDWFFINNLDNWLDFITMVTQTISESDGIYFIHCYNQKHIYFSLVTKKPGNTFLMTTDIMTTEIDDYWI